MALTEEEELELLELEEQEYQAKKAAQEKPMSFGEGLARSSINALPVAGALAGGVAGTVLGPLGMAGGAGLGAAAGKSLEQGLNKLFFNEGAESRAQQYKDIAMEGLAGAAGEGGGQALNKGIEIGAQKVLPKILPSIAKGTSKIGKFLSGADDEALLRNFERPKQMSQAANEEFAYNTGKRAVQETEDLGKMLGENVGIAERDFLNKSGRKIYKDEANNLAQSIQKFLNQNKPSPQGFSALDPKQASELEDIILQLRKGDMTGEDLVKVRDYLDHVEGLASKYEKETGPYTNFLKNLRGEADSYLDLHSPEINQANTEYAQYKQDTNLLRSAKNEGQSEKMINNLYGANKGAQQAAAERLFSPQTLEEAKDIAALKAIENAKGPAGSQFGTRRMGAHMVAGFGLGTGNVPLAIGAEAAVSPKIWEKTLRGMGNLNEALPSMQMSPSKDAVQKMLLQKYFSAPDDKVKEEKPNDSAMILDKVKGSPYEKALQSALQNGGERSFAAANYVLSQRDEKYRRMINGEEIA